MKRADLARRAAAKQRESPRESTAERAAAAAGELGSVIELQHGAGNHAVTSLIGGGAPLEPGLQQDMESRFGEPFADVRVHTGGEAAETAGSIAARAFTVGADIAFADGRFAPDTTAGRTLLAHELAHVVQQRRGGARPPGGVVQPRSALEQSARAAVESVGSVAARAAGAGETVAVTEGAAPVATVSGASAPALAGDFEDDVKKQLGLDKPAKPIVVDPVKTPELYDAVIANQSLASLELPPPKARPGATSAKPPTAAPAQKPMPPGAPKVQPGQEWAVRALEPTGIFDKPVAPLDATTSAALQQLVTPPPPTADERKKMEDAEWSRVPPWVRDSLKQEGIAPSQWNTMVNDLGSMSPDLFRFTYHYDEKTYTSLRELVSDAYRDPANFTPLPDTIDGKVRRALGIGPKDGVPQGKLDVLAQEEAAMSDSQFNKKYGLTGEDHAVLNGWLRHSNRLLARDVDADVMAPDGVIVKESAYESYMLRKRIENFHVPSGTGAVAGAVARVFTDDPDIIGAVSATGDLLETGASFAPQRGAYKDMAAGPAYQPGMRDLANERPAVGNAPPFPTRGSGSGGFRAPGVAAATPSKPMRAPPGGGPRAGVSATEKTVTPFKQQNPEVFKAIRSSAFRNPDASAGPGMPGPAGRTRANTQPFLTDALTKVSSPTHALHALTEPETGTGGVTTFDWRRTTRTTKAGNVQTGRFEGHEHGPTVQVGHRDAFASGAPEVFMLEDADLNQMSGQVIESKGGFSNKEAVEVEGVVVELESLKQWERLGVVPPGTVARARPVR